MKRLNPIGSLLGLILTLLLFIGLGISLWFDRGLAFSPGPVTAKSRTGMLLKGYASHADFEKQCNNCHDPLTTNLATKCVDCHADVYQQIQTDRGVHSQIVGVNECASCHPEHQGRSFDPTLASFQLFDHSATSYSLNWHQENYDITPMQCSECHKNVSFSIVDNKTCLDCHSRHEKTFAESHVRDFGSDCLGCHDGLDQMQNFDHSQTGFQLNGKHGQIKCVDCHIESLLIDSPKDCIDCHGEPTIHEGLFDQTCEACHTQESWSPANINGQPFAHLAIAGFSLVLHQADYSNQKITCNTCHPKDLQTFETQTCSDCHNQQDTAFMTDHQTQFSYVCVVCHDGVDRLSNFDHANFFPLEGTHSSAQCADCHAHKVFRGTPEACWQCHKEPDIHAGVFGVKCYYCHTADAWSPASLQQHIFPLNHGLEDQNMQLQCDACHGANYVDYSCYNCHDHQPDEIIQSHQGVGIVDQEIPDCVKCHLTGNLETSQQYP